jgi:flagellar protein FlgJ
MKALGVNGPGVASSRETHQQKLKKACEDFESIMVTYLFKSMRQTALKADTEDFGSGKDLYEGMMDEALATQLSRQDGLGLARLLYEQLSQTMDFGEVNTSLNGSKD